MDVKIGVCGFNVSVMPIVLVRIRIVWKHCESNVKETQVLSNE